MWDDRFAVRLGDIDASKGLRSIAPALEFMECLCFLLWRVPDFLVHTWSFLAIVFCHSSNGKNLAAVGVGQQNSRNFGDRKCLPEARTSLVGLPDYNN